MKRLISRAWRFFDNILVMGLAQLAMYITWMAYFWLPRQLSFWEAVACGLLPFAAVIPFSRLIDHMKAEAGGRNMLFWTAFTIVILIDIMAMLVTYFLVQ